MNKPTYRYICLDCRAAPLVSSEGRVSLPFEPSYSVAHRHVTQYNHRIGAVNKNGRIVFVYYLKPTNNRFARAPWRDSPPF